MNIRTVAESLRRTIAGKEEYLRQYTIAANELEGVQHHVAAAMRDFLIVNVTELKCILADVEQCCEKATQDSWALNPDRSGVQFTPDEIYNNERSGWIEP